MLAGAAAGPHVLVQHGLDAVAERQIGEAHDPRGHARRPVEAAVAHRRGAGDELRLAHGAQLGRAARAVPRVALHEDRGDDIVTGSEVGEQLVQQVTVVRPLPQVMVGVDDRQLRLENRLGLGAGQPGVVGRPDPPELRRARVRGLAHGAG